jgi:peroxiredoxin
LSKYSKQVVNKNKITFPVLSDENNRYAVELGLDFVLPEILKEVYTTFGIDLPRFNGNDSWKLPMPGRFIIDTSGIIRNIEVHPNHTIRPEPSEIVDLIKSLN